MTQPQTTTSPNPSDSTVTKICATHGAFEAPILNFGIDGVPPVTGRCPKCHSEAQAAAEDYKRRQAEQQTARKIQDRWANSGIPLRFVDRRFDTYHATEPGQKRALTLCRRYADTWPEQRPKGTSLIFSGGPGTGKTHLACAIAAELIETYQTNVRFLTVTDALRAIKDTYRKDAELSEREVLDSLLRPTLLILDEIGVQVGSDHEKLLLFEVLNGRYNDLRPTILLSNLSAADLETYLGQRVMDRYRECGAVIAFDWQSRRGAK